MPKNDHAGKNSCLSCNITAYGTYFIIYYQIVFQFFQINGILQPQQNRNLMTQEVPAHIQINNYKEKGK